MSSSSSSSCGSNSHSDVVTVSSLIKKTLHYDKDERYMATSDLCELLKRHAAATSAAAATTTGSAGTGLGGGEGGVGLDTTAERQICTAVLRLLHDSSHDVQAIAVKTLGVLMTTAQPELVNEIADSLADQILDKRKCELRDVYSIGLCTLLKTVPASNGNGVCKRLINRLVTGCRSSPNNNDSTTTTGSGSSSTSSSSSPTSESSVETDIALACLDALTDMLTRFGMVQSVLQQHDEVLQMCLSLQLPPPTTRTVSSSKTSKSSRATAATTQPTFVVNPVVRKRAGTTLACLAVVLSNPLLHKCVESMLIHLEQQERKQQQEQQQSSRQKKSSITTRNSEDVQREYVQSSIRTLCGVSGSVGHRLGQAHIDRIVPLFLKFTNAGADKNHHHHNNNHSIHHNGDDEGVDDMNDRDTSALNDLRESCFMGFESFVTKCPTQIEPHLSQIIPSCMTYMSYDPNYNYDDDDEEDVMSVQEEEEEKDEEDEEEDMNDDDDEEDGDESDNDNEEEYDDDDDDDDDDDESWKVRRAAIRALKAIVEAFRHNPTQLWKQTYVVARVGGYGSNGKPISVATALVRRFKEREENCRVGVMECFNRLLSVTLAASPSVVVMEGQLGPSAFSSAAAPCGDTDGAGLMDVDVMDDVDTAKVIPIKSVYAPMVVTSCITILSNKAKERSKSAGLALMSTLCYAPGGLGGSVTLTKVFASIKAFLPAVPSSSQGGKNSSSTSFSLSHNSSTGSKALRLDSLSLVHAVLVSQQHTTVAIRSSLPTILPNLCGAVQEQWYKVIAEALRVIIAVPSFYSPEDENFNCDDEKNTQQAQHVASLLYNAFVPFLTAADVDQEIKDCALKACGALLSNLHQSITDDERLNLLQLLLERLQNETTRVMAMKALSQVASAPSSKSLPILDISPILPSAIETLAGLLKNANRSLRQNALETLDILIMHHGASPSLISGELYAAVLQHCSVLIVDADLHLAHLSLCTVVSILKACPNAGASAKEHALVPALILSSSSLLQDDSAALESLLLFFRQMIACSAIEFTELHRMLCHRCGVGSSLIVSKQSLYNLAKCVAIITVDSDVHSRKVLDDIVALPLAELRSAASTESNVDSQLLQLHLALLVTGDIGRSKDLSKFSGVPDSLKGIYLKCFDSQSEDIKHAAAYALGNACVGSQATFLPIIVSKLDEDNRKMQYLLLSALREFIQCSFRNKGGAGITSSIHVIFPPLEKHCSDEEEGVRTMVAECMGSLASVNPYVILPKLDEIKNCHREITALEGIIGEEDVASKRNALVSWTVATAVKYAIAAKVDSSLMAQYMPSFVQLVNQKEIYVRNAALLMIYSAVHHMPQTISFLLRDSVMPSLYEVSELRLERKVDLGPFTHRVDDALPLRKAALSIFASCLENSPSSIDIRAFMPVLAKAMGDAEDIQLHAHQIIISMCTRHPSYIVPSLDSFVEPLDKTLNKKTGQKTGTELERLNDWIKSGLRVMVELEKVDGAMSSRLFSEFVGRIQANSRFTPMLENLRSDEA